MQIHYKNLRWAGIFAPKNECGRWRTTHEKMPFIFIARVSGLSFAQSSKQWRIIPECGARFQWKWVLLSFRLSFAFLFSIFVSFWFIRLIQISLMLPLCCFLFLFSELCGIFSQLDLIPNWFGESVIYLHVMRKWSVDLVPQFSAIMSDRRWSHCAVATCQCHWQLFIEKSVRLRSIHRKLYRSSQAKSLVKLKSNALIACESID